MQLPNKVRVTVLDEFRRWRDDESLGLDWLMPRLLGTQPETENMKAGSALHAALENSGEKEVGSLIWGDYRFDFNCQVEVVIPQVKEMRFEQEYYGILVSGKVDGLIGQTVIDYKTTEQFDWDRYMESYQWRFYLDMSGADEFVYQIFVLAPFGPPNCYSIKASHVLKQYRYPGLHADCKLLVGEYRDTFLSPELRVAS